MGSIRIGVLGPLVVQIDDAEVPVAGTRLRALLTLLAMEPGEAQPVDRLVQGIWGDRPPSDATNALQALVSRLRRAVPGLVLDSSSVSYRLDLEPDAVDSRRFTTLVEQARYAEPTERAALLDEALGLWRGTPLLDLAGTGAADRADRAAASLEEQRLGAVEELTQARLSLGGGAELVGQLDALVAEHPLRERLRALLMRALYAAGRQAEALAAYEDLRARLADELGADPSPPLVDLHVAMLRSDVSLQPAAAPRTNLRTAELTSFVGRAEEVRRVGGLLETARLVTLTGPGGAGKTRLATESARGLTAETPDGVWLVELAPITDPHEVPTAALAAIGFREARTPSGIRGGPMSATDPTARLVSALADRSVLVVLDNCEHLIDAAATLVDTVLAGCPRVRVLTTSREPLGITGEVVHRVPPLDVPESAASAADGLRYAAVRLFADRAGSASPAFALDDTNLPAVLQICARLDGVPLAIELAAARMRTLTLQDIADRLDDRFRLLTAGSRTALPRHQTLRAVVDWSWELLTGDEQQSLRRLSIFAGGFTLASAESVCGAGVSTFTGLVDKSLVVAASDGRYRLLETIKEYAGERLDEAGETAAVRSVYLHFFAAMAEDAEPRLRTGEQARLLVQLSAEQSNIHAALRRAIELPDAETAARIVGSLGWYWFLTDQHAEAMELSLAALRLAGDLPAATRAAVAASAALACVVDQTAMTEIGAFVRRALHDCRSSGVAPRNPLVLMAPVMMRLFTPGLEEAGLAMVPDFFDHEDPWVAGASRLLYAAVGVNIGRALGSLEHFRIAAERFGELGDQWGAFFALSSQAEIYCWQGNPQAALRVLDQAERFETMAVRAPLVGPLQLAARRSTVLWHLGERERARSLIAESLEAAEAAGVLESRFTTSYTAGEIARFDGDRERAVRLLTRALQLTEHDPGPPQGKAMAVTSLGLIYATDGEMAAARECGAEALRWALESRDGPIVGAVAVLVADIAVRQGDAETGAMLIGAGVARRGMEDRLNPDEVRVTKQARAELGPDGFASAVARGRAAAGDEQIVELAAPILSPTDR